MKRTLVGLTHCVTGAFFSAVRLTPRADDGYAAIGSEGCLSAEQIGLIDRYFFAANYLSVGQIYLMDKALLHEPLVAEHPKPRLLGHWGTTPGLYLRAQSTA